MSILKKTITGLCKAGLMVLCDVDWHALDSIPKEGPLVVYANHTGTIEAPVIYCALAPRPKVTGFGKAEIWKNKFLNFIFNIWEVIPVNRGEGDLNALKKAYQAMEDGYIFGLAPEGTRSKDGTLLRAHGGAVMIALRSDCPLIPVAHWGGANFGSNIKKARRTHMELRVGRKFKLNQNIEKVTKEVRQAMADEMMYQLAKLLPEEYRGAYADLENATEKYIEFLD